MEKSKAYDLPTRIFHWIFAALFVTSFAIAKIIDDESTLYAYHMLSGILMVFLVLLRILWGFIGPQTSRFSSFKLNPCELKSYFFSVIQGKSKRYLGHNPASSYAAILMLLFTLGIGFSGMMMTLKISKHFFEEVHELFANGFFMVVIFHIAGVLLHQIKHNDDMIFSMLNGKKAKVDQEEEIKSQHPLVAIILVFLIVIVANQLVKNYDTNTGKLNIIGKQFHLGEDEHENENDHDENHDDD